MTDPKKKPSQSQKKPVEGTEEEFSSPPTFDADEPAKPVENNAPTPDPKPVQSKPEVPQAHDKEDVEALLSRKTHDGKGEDEVPESDFISFATDGVERLPVEVVAQEVLNGKLGNYQNSRDVLRGSGYDPREVQIEVNRRLSSGAPSAHAYSTKELAQQVIRGEWGRDEEFPRNLESAGYDYQQVKLEVNRQLGR